MKFLFLIIFFLISNITISQEKYLDRNGVLIFEASEQTFEPVKAENNSVSVILNIQTGEIASLALVKEFQFRNALMEEHFNENYAESNIYSKTKFRGKITHFDLLKINENGESFNVIGILNFHGINKEIEIKLIISKKDELIYIKGDFFVSSKDFDIKIPKIVRNKIAKEIKIKIDFKLNRK